MNGVLGLKIDVDTYQGMKKGVPRLLEVLAAFDVKGTFYLSIGPDASGLAVLQLLKNPLFLKKMIHTNAPGLYGLKTALYGTILPSPMIALSFPGMVRDIMEQGHEVQFHAWDHRRWQDSLLSRPESWIRTWFEKGMTAFEKVTGRPATSFGAPAWLMDNRVLNILKDYPLDYLSCTRAPRPFIHELLGIPEIPSDLPCFEEVGPAGGADIILERLQSGGMHILPVHAEVEGGIWREAFVNLMHHIQRNGYVVNTLGDIRRTLVVDALERCPLKMGLLPGRSVPCCI
ncbi:MAG: undecaprenyl phosphate-alpha-L-ara4FN deformylase [Syntrophus sp. SKADARSKE-3]|nr:undecaprenyl phosphate-alpha-L-ara4FN deformylase [Syntrophus sp. SKADARSKE-3]